MDLTIERVEVWATTIDDKPGRLANILTGLREAGADLNFILARRAPEQPDKAVVFVTPLQGDAELEAAATLGFNPTTRVHAVRVEGANRPGIAAELASLLAAAGINLRGFSAAVLGTLFVLYLGLDSAEDATQAASILQHA
jgi:hypothetical protein